MQGGGGDNISIQFLRFAVPWTPGPETGVSRDVKWFGVRARIAIPIGLAAVCLLAAGAWLTYFNLQHPFGKANPMHLDDAPGPTQPAISSIPAKPGTTLLLVTAAGAPLPDWSAKLQGLGTLDIRRQQGSKQCLSLMQGKGVLYNLPRAAAAAKDIRQKLNLDPSVVIELPPDMLAPCADTDLIVVPAKPSTAPR